MRQGDAVMTPPFFYLWIVGLNQNLERSRIKKGDPYPESKDSANTSAPTSFGLGVGFISR